MSEEKQREKWLRDVQDRQRNVVFPETLANETRFWRNIGRGKPSVLTWAGLIILAFFVFGFLAITLVISTREGVTWAIALATVLIVGPIFGVVVWATWRNLRNLENSRRNSSTR